MARLKAGVRLKRLRTKRVALEKLIVHMRRQQLRLSRKLNKAYRELEITEDRIEAKEGR